MVIFRVIYLSVGPTNDAHVVGNRNYLNALYTKIDNILILSITWLVYVLSNAHFLYYILIRTKLDRKGFGLFKDKIWFFIKWY